VSAASGPAVGASAAASPSDHHGTLVGAAAATTLSSSSAARCRGLPVSAYGPGNGWYRRAKARRAGRVRAGGVERDVQFAEPAAGVHPAIDAAYHTKYDRYGPQIVGTVTGPSAAAVTLRLVPADTS
jgi:Uncharacterized protein conserved in bacteria (DUF2255)